METKHCVETIFSHILRTMLAQHPLCPIFGITGDYSIKKGQTKQWEKDFFLHYKFP